MLRRLFAALAATSAFCLAVWALAWGLADLGSITPRRTLSSWERSGQVDDLGDWGTMYTRLQWARQINPYEAQYSVDLGRLWAWQAWRMPVGSSTAAAYRQQALAYYVEALGKRPDWGFGWALAAEGRALTDGPDEAVQRALSRAASRSPWEPNVQQKVVWLGFALWEGLADETRKQVVETARRALQASVNRDAIMRFALQYGRDAELEALLQEDGDWERWRGLKSSQRSR